MKKIKIREYVEESELRFQLYLMKSIRNLKKVRVLDKEEINKEFEFNIKKRINLLNLYINKETDEEIIKNCETIKVYLKNLKPLNEEEIFKEFNFQKNIYLDRIKIDKTIINEEKRNEKLKEVNNIFLNENTSKERFGELIIFMIENMKRMPSFSSYTEVWKDEFQLSALEDVFCYSHNFDENIISKRTGKKANAFAYITQICYQAFVKVIKKNKAEIEFLKTDLIEKISENNVLKQIKQEFGNEIYKNDKEDGDNIFVNVEEFNVKTKEDILNIISEKNTNDSNNPNFINRLVFIKPIELKIYDTDFIHNKFKKIDFEIIIKTEKQKKQKTKKQKKAEK